MTDTPQAPQPVGYTDADPCPRIEVTVPPGADNHFLSVFRWDSAGRTAVRGAAHASISGTFFVVDFEAPLGEPVSYTAIGYDTQDRPSEPSLVSTAVTLAGDGGCPWVHDPLIPSGATRWLVTDWTERTHGRDRSVLWPIVSDVAVVITGPRQKPASTMELITRTDGDAQALVVLSDSPALLIRPDPSWGWRYGYYNVGELEERRRVPGRPANPDRLWSLPLTPVAPPPPELEAPAHTWAEVIRLYDRWRSVVATKRSWLDLIRDPDPAAP